MAIPNVMIYLFLCIFSSSFILLLFKYIDKKGIDPFQAIVVNYLAASIMGVFLIRQENFSPAEISLDVLLISLIVGTLFILVFFLIARSTKFAGVSTTSVATKMSVVIPILFSIVRYGEVADARKITGIMIALAALFLTVYRKEPGKRDPRGFIFPVLIFFGTGIVDTTIKYSQAEHIDSIGIARFNTYVFLTSLVIGLAIAAFSYKKQISKFKPAVLLSGTLLGFANFGSLYFIISALNKSGLDSSVVFPINNIGVVLVSVIFAIILFREKLSILNMAGILTAVAAVIILM
jgi:drug/metabolite transporter (DMT)-like permease